MGQNILVTGTSSGFGRLTALSLARRGHHVFAAMRDAAGKNRAAADDLRAAAEGEGREITVVELDVTRDASVDDGVASVLAKAGHLGVSLAGIEETLTGEQIQHLFNTNVVGPHRVARAVLPSMRARKQGLLIGVSSTVSRVTLPFMGAYCASKAAFEALFQAYRHELKPTGVESVLVQPGAHPTEFTQKGGFGADQDRARAYGPVAAAMGEMFSGVAAMMSGPNAPNPQEVADAIVQLVETPAGSRPAHVIVDRMFGALVTPLNEKHDDAQHAVLGPMGLGMML
jgi:NAD(P)-dependent dehydrogenase (short-subunit alcohol dehydrogenase family)